MKVVLAILLNVGLLVLLLPWLRRQWCTAPAWARLALALSLGLRLTRGILSGQVLVHDARYMSEYGRLLTAQLWAAPEEAVRTFMGNELHYAGQELIFHGMSNTFFFVKILAFLNLASLNTDWLNAVYLSVFGFVGCWQLVRTLAQVLPQTPAAAGVIAFALWPSVIFWSSGVTKESVVVGSGAWLLAVFVRLFFGDAVRSRAQRWSAVLVLLLLAMLHFKMRYFFAVPLLGALAALAMARPLQQLGMFCSRWAQIVLMALVLSSGAWVATEVSVAFRLNKFMNQVMRNYSQNLTSSAGRPHFEYPDLQPTATSLVRHLPLAATNALVRPWLGESTAPQYVMAGLENALLLVLLMGALAAAGRGKSGQFPFELGLVLVVHCLVLAVLLGLTTPNLGSLNRYRSGLLPYLLLLLLQNDYAAAVLRRLGLERGSWR